MVRSRPRLSQSPTRAHVAPALAVPAFAVRARRGLALLVLIATGLFAPVGGVRAQDALPVDLELVLAVDISGSVDPEEARLQREGYIRAIADPRVVKAITEASYGRIAVVYLEWSTDNNQRVVVPWTLIDGPRAAETFASTLGEAAYVTGRWTSISGAIDTAMRLFAENRFEGMRRVIDVSGDGYNNSGRPVTSARDDAVAAGVTINGLPILNDRPNPWGGQPPADLDRYYQDYVIGGPGAFSEPAENFEDFGRAILAKLVREVANLDHTPTDLRRPPRRYAGLAP